jgi:hypothetical protein
MELQRVMALAKKTTVHHNRPGEALYPEKRQPQGWRGGLKRPKKPVPEPRQCIQNAWDHALPISDVLPNHVFYLGQVHTLP